MVSSDGLLNVVTLIALTLALAGSAFSQEMAPETDSLGRAAVNIYIDGPYSQSDYFRIEITMANFVRDRRQADIHILTTSQETGSGGREYTIEFMGQREFEGLRDTLIFHSTESDTEDNIRSGLVRTINLGLVRYVARTDQAKHLSVDYSVPGRREEPTDKWNRWVFEVEADFWTNGQRSTHSVSIGGDIEARRVTEESRFAMGVYGNYNENRFEHDDETTLDISSNKGADVVNTWSLGDHWSAGGVIEVYSSTYSNKKAATNLFPALEYNYFPYAESTRRQFTFTYFAGVTYVDYEKETLFDKHNEWLYQEELNVTLIMIEPWGDADMSLTGSHYFHDISKYRLRLSASMSVNLTEGLSFNINGSTSRIHDQLNLSKGDLSKDDVLLRRTELATDYDYSVSFGISYTFGSIYNDAVNPRFGF